MRALILLLALAGCTSHVQSTPEPIVVIQKVNVPVVAGCVPRTLGAAPDYVDTNSALRLAPDGAVRYQLLIAGRLQRGDRLNELELVVRSCPKAK
jgi:hypothetical protein